MKKNRIVCLVLCLIMLFQLLSSTVYASQTEGIETTEPTSPIQSNTENDSSVTYGCHTVDAKVPLIGMDRLLETAGAAMLYEVNSDTLLYAWNPDMPVYPASLAKIMTALLAVEHGNLAEIVTVSANAMSSIQKQSATLKLQIGEQLTLEQLVRCLMVGSANDAAVVIADHIAGSQQGFVAMMNQRAAELGCTGTVFVNPHGLHNSKQITTTRDMVKILKFAMKNEEFMSFFSDTVYTLPATNLSKSRYMETTNYMMTRDVTEEYFDSRVTGGRTGVTEDRRRCLIVTAKSGELCFIAIVMNAVPKADPDDPYTIKYFGSYEEVGDLLDMGFRDYRIAQVLSDNEILTQYMVTNGTNAVSVGPLNSRSTVLPKTAMPGDLTVKYASAGTTLSAPVDPNVVVNTVQMWYGNVCLAQSPLITKNTSRLKHTDTLETGFQADGNSFATKILIVVGVLVVGVLAIIGVRTIMKTLRGFSANMQHKRRRRNRRRSR